MPARSQAQREYLNAKFGHDWVKEHHFDNSGKLPDKVSKGRKKSVKADVKSHMDKLSKGLRT